MKTGNKQTPNPKNLFGKGMKQDNSNMVATKNKAQFSAKRDPKKGNKHG